MYKLFALCFLIAAVLAADVQVIVGPSTSTRTFSPASITISKGDTINFVWQSNYHNVAEGDITNCTRKADGFYSGGPVNPPQSYNLTFNNVGTFTYFCEPHCELGMKGTVVVVDGPVPTTSGGHDTTSSAVMTSPLFALVAIVTFGLLFV